MWRHNRKDAEDRSCQLTRSSWTFWESRSHVAVCQYCIRPPGAKLHLVACKKLMTCTIKNVFSTWSVLYRTNGQYQLDLCWERCGLFSILADLHLLQWQYRWALCTGTENQCGLLPCHVGDCRKSPGCKSPAPDASGQSAHVQGMMPSSNPTLKPWGSQHGKEVLWHYRGCKGSAEGQRGVKRTVSTNNKYINTNK